LVRFQGEGRRITTTTCILGGEGITGIHDGDPRQWVV
jgi:hypothetical protein